MKLSNDFYVNVFARFSLSFAVQLQATLMGWQMYEFTRDPLQLGFVGLAEAIPALSLSLFAGYLVDRGDPKKIYISVLCVSTLSVFLAWFAKNPTHLFLSAALTGTVRGFASPAIQTIVPRLVAKEQLKQANTWTTSAHKLATISGPALGGALLAFSGKDLPYALAFGMLACAIIAYPTIRVPMPEKVKASQEKREDAPFLDELLLGLRFVLRDKFLFAALTLDMFAVLFGGVTAILPMYAKEILELGPEGLGILRAAPAVGAFLMTVILIRKPFIRAEGKMLFWVVIGFGLCVLGFGFSKELWLSCLFLACAGGLDSISMVIRGALVQLLSPEAMRGRIAAVNSLFIGSSNELGAFESGAAARILGLIPSIFFGGGMTLLTVLAVYRMTPRLYQFTLKQLSEARQ